MKVNHAPFRLQDLPGDVPSVPIAQSDLEVGDLVLAIGNRLVWGRP